MAGSVSISSKPNASGLKVAIVSSRFNFEVTNGLVQGAFAALRECGADPESIVHLEVPGAFELPLALKVLASSGSYDALIALGAVIQGETAHFEHISDGAMRGISEVMLAYSIPIGCGVLTTYNEEQARARSGDNEQNKGREAALAAIEMAQFQKVWSK